MKHYSTPTTHENFDERYEAWKDSDDGLHAWEFMGVNQEDYTKLIHFHAIRQIALGAPKIERYVVKNVMKNKYSTPTTIDNFEKRFEEWKDNVNDHSLVWDYMGLSLAAYNAFARQCQPKTEEVAEKYDKTNASGIKYDDDKPDYSLIPPSALEDAVRVLTFGAKKYDRDNWKQVPNGKHRYFAALCRHAFAVLKGETKDKESGLSHWAHVIANAMFLYELYKD